MKTIWNLSFVKGLLLLTAVLSLSTSYAAAQSTDRGTFTLPSAAHWGVTVLPAGSYSFSVETDGSYPVVTVRSMDGKIEGMFVAEAVSQSDAGAEVLTLVRRGDDMYVRSLNLTQLSETLEYKMPKAAETSAVAGLTTP